MTVLDGMSHEDFEQHVGRKLDPKVLFFLRGRELYFKTSGRWHRGSDS